MLRATDTYWGNYADSWWGNLTDVYWGLAKPRDTHWGGHTPDSIWG